MGRHRFIVVTALIGTLGVARAAADESAIAIADAHTPPAATKGGDVPLFMTITNSGSAADALTRVRCDAADFTSKVTSDVGEGGTSVREVRTIAVPPGQTVRLEPSGIHVMLLHTHASLATGDRFECSIVFQSAGAMTVIVTVAAQQSAAPPSQ